MVFVSLSIEWRLYVPVSSIAMDPVIAMDFFIVWCEHSLFCRCTGAILAIV